MSRPAAAGLEIRGPRGHELEAFADCVEVGFAQRLGPRRRELLLSSLDPDRALAAFAGGELVGTVAGASVELTLPGSQLVEVLALAEAAVRPTHRRRGILTELVGRSLGDARERGDVAVVLEASEGGIYRRFGFGPATAYARYELDRARSRLESPPPARGEVVLLGEGDAAEAFPLVLDAARRQRAGEICRPRPWWDDVLVPEDAERSASRFYAAYVAAGSVDGYAIYEVRAGERSRRELVVDELVAATDDAYVGLAAYLVGVDLVDRIRTGPRPLDEPLRHLLADPRALETVQVSDGMWIRLVDVGRALALRRYGAPGRVVLAVADERCPWNAATYALEVDAAGSAAVTVTGASSELELDVAALAELYLGAGGALALRGAGRVRERAEGSCARLEAMLRAERPPFCTAL